MPAIRSSRPGVASRSAYSICFRSGSSFASVRSRCCCSRCSASASLLPLCAPPFGRWPDSGSRPWASDGSGRSFKPASFSGASSSRQGCSAIRSPPSGRSFASSSDGWTRSARMTSAAAAEPASLSVLFLTHAFPRWSGDAAGSFILRLARALGDQRIRVRVLAPHAPDLPTRETISGIDVIRFRYAPASFETLAYTGTMAEQVGASWPARAALLSMLGAGFGRALREQRRLRPALLHAHWWFPSGVLGAAMKHLSPLPLVTTMHGSDVRLARSTRPARSAFRWVMAGSDASTSVSRWLAEQAQTIAPAPRPPIVAPMPAATDLFTPGPGRERDRLLFVGRLNAQKGIELLLRALREMQRVV